MSEDSADRAAILARRARYVALALTGTTMSTMATACACLSPGYESPDTGGIDGGTEMGPDGGPDALSRYPRDAGQDVTTTLDAASEDAATDEDAAIDDAASHEDAAAEDAAAEDAPATDAP